MLITLACVAVAAWLLSQGMRADSSSRALLKALLEQVRDPHWGLVYVLVAYGLGTLVFAPITVLFMATSLSMAPLLGATYCVVGGLFSASLAHAAGRLLEARLMQRLPGKLLTRLRHQVHTRPFRSVLIARFLPVGNFTVINLFLGGLGVPFGKFLLGNVVGMMPAVLAIAIGKELLLRVIHAPDLTHLVWFLLGGGIVVSVLYVLSRKSARHALLAQRKPPGDAD